MVRHTDFDTTESLANLSEGDVVRVSYDSNRSDATKTFEAEVRNVDVTPATDYDDLFGWVDVDLCRTATDTGDDLVDDDHARRRLSASPGDSFDVEARATTINGFEFRRISDHFGDITVERVEDEPEDDEDDDRDPFDMTPTDAEIAEAFGVEDVDDITDEMLEDVDTPEPPERVDVSGYKSATGAAKKTHEALQEWAEFMGYDPEAVHLYDRDDTEDKRGVDAWCVAWEGGPYEWASALSGGTTLTGFAGPKPVYDGEPEVTGLTSGDGFDVECYYSFDLLFFDA